MNQDELKKQVALEAIKYIQPKSIIGVGTGSTVAYFIENLKEIKDQIIGVVSSSIDSTKKLQAIGVNVLDCNDVSSIALYIDGADEINHKMQMIKGGGAALTREKIIAGISEKFICIVDESKVVPELGRFPLPIEVIPMARSFVARELFKLGAKPIYRQDIITDNGNVILDIHNFMIHDPVEMEQKLNNIPGVVTVGLFALKPAHIALIGTKKGIKTMTK